MPGAGVPCLGERDQLVDVQSAGAVDGAASYGEYHWPPVRVQRWLCSGAVTASALSTSARVLQPSLSASTHAVVEDLHLTTAIEPPLCGAQDGIDVCQAFVQPTSPPGNTIVGVARHLLAEP